MRNFPRCTVMVRAQVLKPVPYIPSKGAHWNNVPDPFLGFLCNSAYSKELGTFKGCQEQPGCLWAESLRTYRIDESGCKILIQDQARSPRVCLRPSELEPSTLITRSILLHRLTFFYFVFVHSMTELPWLAHPTGSLQSSLMFQTGSPWVKGRS